MLWTVLLEAENPQLLEKSQRLKEKRFVITHPIKIQKCLFVLFQFFFFSFFFFWSDCWFLSETELCFHRLWLHVSRSDAESARKQGGSQRRRKGGRHCTTHQNRAQTSSDADLDHRRRQRLALLFGMRFLFCFFSPFFFLFFHNRFKRCVQRH